MLKDQLNKNQRLRFIVPVVGLAMLVGCGSDSNDVVDSTQVVARVNDTEVTIHQLNLELTDKRLASQPNKEQVQRAVLERLINQALLEEQALEQKLHRNPITMQAMERAKKQVLAQAYMQTVLGSLGLPTEAEMELFYNEHPELFSKRRVYHLQQLSFEPGVDKDAIIEQLAKVKDFAEFTRWTQSQEINAQAKTIVQGAERLSKRVLDKIKDLSAGSGALIEVGDRSAAVWVVAAREVAFDKEQAKPFIQKHLMNVNRSEAMKQEVERLRAASHIEYKGAFANQPVTQSTNKSSVANEESIAIEEPEVSVSDDTTDFVDKGISGLK